MFNLAITKTQRVRKLMRQINDNYDAIMRHFRFPSDTELCKLAVSKRDLDLATSAAYFDSVKQQYPAFNQLTHTSLWKLVKPNSSEGTVFTVNGGYLLSGLREILPLVPIQLIEPPKPKYSLVMYLRLAVLQKAKADYEQEKAEWWLSINGDMDINLTDEQYNLGLNIANLPDNNTARGIEQHFYSHELPVISHFAKHFQTNLVTLKD